MELNGTEIDLCNQIAKKHRKEIEYGDWHEFKGRLYLQKSKADPILSTECIPIWNERQCLEFLKSRKFLYSIYDQADDGGTVIDIFVLIAGSRSLRETLHGTTLLEACLLAVLIILQNQDNEVKATGN